MTDVIEDLEILLARAINCLGWILNEIHQRILQNQHRPLNRRTLVRWISVFMPKPRDPRLKLLSDLQPDRLDRWASCGSLLSVESFVSLNEVIQENLGNNFVRFRRGQDNEDSDSFEEPQFVRYSQDRLTSTPNMNASSCSSQMTNDLTANLKLAEMEDELAVLRKQIAMLVMAQELTPVSQTQTDEARPAVSYTEQAVGTELPHSTDTSLEDSGCESENLPKSAWQRSTTNIVAYHPGNQSYNANTQASRDDLAGCFSHCSVAPPPPPPPLPPKPSNISSLTSVKSQSKTTVNTCHQFKGDSQSVHRPNVMAHVLKDLSNVKLKAVQRSPGGTPMRRKPLSVPSDPASIIAQALKKKFASHKGYSSDSDLENDSHSFRQDQNSLTGESKRRLSIDNTSDGWSPATSPLKLYR
ncbi:mitochondrial fission regulator 2 [Biomphalaria glabrata]|uniref:Mitochondrial fission regulator 2-like n=1 Tax=Biomphalaria glabrata TaxID=6526 RepID=A0A9U8EJV9_BIOGL|nr:mitochondrial fission regulator 2-like [Biomphalaria glabrata]KAI8773218.1 mitochondrial fission regulator 2 [Biomphalaria glabrata]